MAMRASNNCRPIPFRIKSQKADATTAPIKNHLKRSLIVNHPLSPPHARDGARLVDSAVIREPSTIPETITSLAVVAQEVVPGKAKSGDWRLLGKTSITVQPNAPPQKPEVQVGPSASTLFMSIR